MGKANFNAPFDCAKNNNNVMQYVPIVPPQPCQ